MINELYAKGADVIFEDAHVSGHARQEEIKLIYSLVQPRYSIPVHGEYRHLKAQANLVHKLGMDKDNIFILHSGDVLELSEEAAKVTGKVPVGSIFVDGLGVGDVGNIVIRDRQHLAEDGILIVVVALDCENNVVVSGPDIVSRGFVYVRESDELLDGARDIVSDVLDDCIDRNISDWGRMKNAMKDSLNEYFWKNIGVVRDFLAENMPEVKMIEPEGTYLLWIDFSAWNMEQDDLMNAFAEAGVRLNSGTNYGECGKGYVRLNVATQTAVLKKGLECIKVARDSHMA